jgi:hypothetical protein
MSSTSAAQELAPDDWLDIENDLQSAIIVACERQGLAEDLARLVATDALLECRRRIVERTRTMPRD